MENSTVPRSGINRSKFLIGGFLILAAVVYLIFSSTMASAQYFLTVDELANKGQENIGRSVRISGAVLGDSIQYDPQTLTLNFYIAHVQGSNKEIEAQGGLAKVLHDAVMDPTRARIPVEYVGPKPDLLQHEAQAIMTGRLNEDGIFYADELLLKCPTKYEEAVPVQSEG
jgi:cytochrome c-type biogenesis protein CcmE